MGFRTSCLLTALPLIVVGLLVLRGRGRTPKLYAQAAPPQCCKYNSVDVDKENGIVASIFGFRKRTRVIAKNHSITPKHGECIISGSECALATKECGVTVSVDLIANAGGPWTDTYEFWCSGTLVHGSMTPRKTATAGPGATWETMTASVDAWCHGDIRPAPCVQISGGRDCFPDCLGTDFIEVEFTCVEACDY